MKAHLILLVCCLAEAYSKCPLRAPVGKLVDGCKTGNLTVIAYPSREIINDMLCNTTADEVLFNYVPQYLRFQRMLHTPAPGYLMTAVDLTSKKLIWMVSNLTVSSDLSIFPSGNRYSQQIISFHKPDLNQFSRQHVIEFQVFEEFRNHPSKTYIHNNAIFNTPFNLSSWIDSQQSSGITLCGPVAGGSVVAYQQPPAPRPGPQPAHPTKPVKGNANRIAIDGMSLVGFVIVFRALGF